MKFNVLSMIAAGVIAMASCSQAPSATSLKDAYSDSFMIGCAVNPNHTSGRLTQAKKIK